MRDFVNERRGQLRHQTEPVHVREIPLQLAQPLTRLLRAHGCCHIGAGAPIPAEFSLGVKHRFATCLHVHRRAVAVPQSNLRSHEMVYVIREVPKQAATSRVQFQGRERDPSRPCTPCRFGPPDLNQTHWSGPSRSSPLQPALFEG